MSNQLTTATNGATTHARTATTPQTTSSVVPVVKPPVKSTEIISIEAEQVKAPRTIQEFFESLDKGTELAKRFKKFSDRVKEIREFRTASIDESTCILSIVHPSGQKIEFSQNQAILDFLDSQLEKGEFELQKLDGQMKTFVM